MRQLKYCLQLFLFLNAFTGMYAHAAITLTDSTDNVKLGHHLQVYSDKSRELTIADITSAKYQALFQDSQVETLNFGFNDAAHWIAIDVRYETDTPNLQREWFLEIDFPVLDHVDLYRQLPDGTWVTKLAGDSLPFASRPISYGALVHPITLTNEQTERMYLRIQSSTTVLVPLTLRSAKGFAEHINLSQLGNGLYYGTLSVMILYNLFLFFAIRDKSYLLYILYILGFELYQLQLRGHGYEFLWPDNPWFTARANGFFVGMTSFFAVLFTARFLDTAKHHPTAHKILLFLACVGGFQWVASLIFDPAIFIKIGTIIAVFSASSVLGVAIYSLSKGNPVARFYLLAWSTFLTAIVIFAFTALGILPANFFTLKALEFGSVLEVLLLSFALADRIGHIQREKDAAQQSAMEHLKRFQSVFEHAEEGLFQCHLDGSFISANPALVRILGFTNAEELREAVPDIRGILEPDVETRAIALTDFAALQKRGAISGLDIQFRRRSGQIGWASLSLRFLERNDGRHSIIEGSLADVTERKQNERSRREKEAAEASAKAKGEFLANMSHEIRTPMNAIIGFSSLALKSDSMQKQKDFLHKIRASSQSLLGIINDILDFSKIEAGKLDLVDEEFSLPTVIENLSAILGTVAVNKGLEFIVDVDANVPTRLIGDPMRLGQILTNLINNAIKFTECGEIYLSIHLQESDKQHAVLLIIVKDTGIGISPEKSEHLFKAFSQADESTARKYGGTGLGLSISKQLSSMMGGHISLRSEENIGTEFHVTLPFSTSVNSSTFGPYLDAELAGKKLLVIESNTSMRGLLTKNLSALGCIVRAEPEIVASTLQQTLVNPSYDCIVATFSAIKGKCDGADLSLSKTPLLLLTAPDNDEIDDIMSDCDNCYHIHKPLDFEQLKRAVTAVTSELGQWHETAKDDVILDDIPDLKKYRLLLVEDNQINQLLAKELLVQTGVKLDVVQNGQEAIDILCQESFDIVLMDVQMPIMDGYEATESIRSHLKLTHLPIIAMTANAMRGDKEKCLDAGMNDYLTKPIEQSALFDCLRRWLKAHDIVQSEQLHHTTQKITESALLNIEASIERLGGNRKLFNRVCKDFLDRYQDVDQQVQGALQNGRMEDALRLLHTTKGLAATLSAEQLSQLAYRWESALTRKDDTQDISPIFSDCLALTIQNLDQYLTHQSNA